MAVDELAKRLRISIKKKGLRSPYTEASLEEKKLVLLKPQTYMNRSGEAVLDAVGFFKIPVKNIIVVHDEIDLPLGNIKVKVGGGSAGHKGIQSMISHLGDSGFMRVRVGIGKPTEKPDVINHVLSSFKKEEEKIIKDVITRAADAVLEIILRGVESAMNKFNIKPEGLKLAGLSSR
jgi:PTH1 family peptidyl-tRNA hydrolase